VRFGGPRFRLHFQEVTSGAPLYLVSACGTAEEFVAAFRRYADRTGLFVPSHAPLPAGRKGRIAVTLKDGGVMIEGEAEILQSSSKPTVLYGRPGMTIKFVEPDDFSKIIIGELEKARLAMKVPAPSVPPRPANIPAEPRPTPPAVGGRIDATNALAECVVIGDPSTLKETANAPRTIGGEGSGKAKFVVPSIPTAPGGRMKTPSIPGEPTAVNAAPPAPPPKEAPKVIAKEPSKPTPAPIAKEPSKPTPTPIAKEPSKPTADPRMKMTSIGFPAIDKMPAAPAKPTNPLLDTKLGTDAPPNPTKEIPAAMAPENPLLQTQHGVGVSKPVVAAAPAVKPVMPTDDEATSIGELPPKKITDPMPTAAPSKSAEQSAVPGLLPEPPKAQPKQTAHKATSIGFPALRTPFETQPVGVVPPPTNTPRDGEPSAPIVAKPKPGAPSGPRGKNPTTPPLSPRHPTPVAPLPIVRGPAKPAVADEDEKTDLSSVPKKPDLPDEEPMPQAVDPFTKTEVGVPARSGGMRASEIMAAIPTEDWTMTPDASGPTVLPTAPKPEGEEPDAEPSGPTKVEGKSAPKGPPTGNWTIQLDPEAGWSEPQKLPPSEAAAPAPAPKPAAQAVRQTPKSGNPVMAVASSKAIEAVEWEDKPTGIGEAKIEVDATLMEPLKPMPALDDDSDDPVASPPAPLAPPPSRITGPAPTRPDVVPPPLAPMPPVGTANIPVAAIMSPTGSMQAAAFPGFGTTSGFPAPPASMHELGASGSVAALGEPSAAAQRKRMIIIIAAAAFAVVAGFVLVLMLAGGKSKKTSAGKGSAALIEKGSAGSAQQAIAPAMPDAAAAEEEGSAEEGSAQGSAEIAIQPPDQGSAVAPPPPTDGKCQVSVTSVPTGADVYLAKAKIGTTPGTFELPCDAPSTLSLRKAKFIATDKTFTPKSDKDNKVVVKLGKNMFSLKVTSTPSGATITVGGKSAGVTPATVKVVAYEASSITLTKPGYAKDTQRVTPKSNGQAHHVVLKKGR
jgi:hypothetical protein